MNSTIFLVEDDEAVSMALTLLLEVEGLQVSAYDSAEKFLEACPRNPSGCLLLDLRLPGMSGLELQQELGRRDIRLPIIFLSGHGDVPVAVVAVKAGAVDFLEKPAPADVLLPLLREALRRDEERREKEAARAEALNRVDRLSTRERKIMDLVVAGRTNKEIASTLGISFRTVEGHRARVRLKTGTASMHELAQLAADCGPAAKHET